MLMKKKITLIISLFITLNIANAAPLEEFTKKPSSATRIARFRKQALKFGRRFAGTKEYSSEEVQNARAKTFAALATSLFIFFVGYRLNPFGLLARDPNPKKENLTPSREASSTMSPLPKSEWPGWTGAVIDWWYSLPRTFMVDPHGARPELYNVQTPD